MGLRGNPNGIGPVRWFDRVWRWAVSPRMSRMANAAKLQIALLFSLCWALAALGASVAPFFSDAEEMASASAYHDIRHLLLQSPPNRRTVEARQLCSDLVLDSWYQAKLRSDFVRRRLHPSIEALIWAYHLGQPRENIALTGEVNVNQRLIAERTWLRENLDLEALETLVSESQALIARAMEKAGTPPPADKVIDALALKPLDKPVA